MKRFDKIWHNFRNFGQKSKFSKVLAKIKIFRKFRPMPRLLKKFNGNKYFPKILTKMNIFENFDQNQEF